MNRLPHSAKNSGGLEYGRPFHRLMIRRFRPGNSAWILSWLVVCCALTTEMAAAQDSISTRSGPAARQYDSGELARVLTQAGRHLATISARTTPAVVNIESTRQSRSGTLEETGSGVIMTSPRVPDIFVVTNRHVVADASLNQIEILLFDGRVIYPLEKLEDPDSDLAVLKIADPDIEPAQFGDSDNLDIGHFVMAMGSPFGLQQSVTLGIISAKGRRSLELPGRRVINQNFLQTDAAINPGNSGGPLIDLDGRVVGINTAIASQGGGNEGIGFSIPSNLVKFVVNQLLEGGRVRRGYLGIVLDENFDFEAARNHSLDRKYGARIVQVTDRTPAAAAGLLPDDVVLNFDGYEIEDETDLINRVSQTPVNKRVRMVVMRDGRRVTIEVTLTERPDRRDSRREERRSPHEREIHRNSGFSVFKLNPALAVQTGYSKSQQGLMVREVDAAADGLRVYDVIEEVGRQPVKTPEELSAALDRFRDQPSVVLKVRRIVEGRPRSLLVLWKQDRLKDMNLKDMDSNRSRP